MNDAELIRYIVCRIKQLERHSTVVHLPADSHIRECAIDILKYILSISHKNDWISVKDSLPKKQYGYEREDDILFYRFFDKRRRIGYFDGICFISDGEPYLIENAFWMPLPEIPKWK